MKRLVIIFAMVLIVVGCKKPNEKSGKVKKDNSPRVQVISAKRSDYVSKLKYYGTFNSLNKYDIKAEASGNILKIYKNVGDFVSKNSNLAKIDPFVAENNLRQAKGAFLSSKSALSLAKIKFHNDSLLYLSKSISKLAFLQSENNMNGAISHFYQATSSYKNAKRAYNKTLVKPIYSGVISAKYIKKGALVGNGTPLFRINQMDKMLFSISVSQDVVKNIKKNMLVDSIVCNGDVYRGSIFEVAPEADAQTSSYKVTIAVKNKKRKILDGFNGQVILKSQKFNNIFVLPSNSIIKKDGKTFVFVLSGNIVRIKNIDILKFIDGVALVVSGIDTGNKVVITNTEMLRDGLKVNKQ